MRNDLTHWRTAKHQQDDTQESTFWTNCEGYPLSCDCPQHSRIYTVGYRGDGAVIGLCRYGCGKLHYTEAN